MSTGERDGSVIFGIAALIAGVLSAFGAFMIYATSTFLNPPDAVRMPVMALFPLGLIASPALAAAAFRGRGRAAALVGLATAFAGLAFFLFTIFALG